ncbi:MAG: hypothetical protein KC635_13590 [Myxococcales bacterium]|nr:hypothetical protein [Myxococcales bacterium]MCB9736397.1 hypothetical protein [Deltaproteobacteria bacterium]
MSKRTVVRGLLTIAAVTALAACSTSRAETVSAEESPMAEGTPPAAPVKKRAPGLPQEQRDALKKQYTELAKKNDCSEGYDKLDGHWRFAGETKTPNYSDELTITGSTYTEKLVGDPDGKHVEATISGRIECLFKNRVLMTLDTVKPEGAFENRSGDSYPCDVLGDLANTGDRMLMICYFDWDVRTASGWEFEWERVKE